MRGEVELMADRNGNERIVNVEVCMRVGGEEPIVICSVCHNEVEGTVLGVYADDAIYSYEVSPMPLYDYCPWCSAPLREDVR
jgi:hypothetical protein